MSECEEKEGGEGLRYRLPASLFRLLCRWGRGAARPPSRHFSCEAMAPLLGRKPFPLAKPLPPAGGEKTEGPEAAAAAATEEERQQEPRFVIPHTQEVFRTSEYPVAGDGFRFARGRAGGEGKMQVMGEGPPPFPPPLLLFTSEPVGEGRGLVFGSPPPLPHLHPVGGRGNEEEGEASEARPAPPSVSRALCSSSPSRFLSPLLACGLPG